MFKRFKIWVYLAALFGGSLFQFGGGCLGLDGLGGNSRVFLAILREELFS